MSNAYKEGRSAFKAIIIFLAILIPLSCAAYYAILCLQPASIYVGALMICPAVSAMITLKILGRPILGLPWGLKSWRPVAGAYLAPVVYISLAYSLIWVLGFGGVPNSETITAWAAELGLETQSPLLVVFIMTCLLATVGVIKNLGSTLGEEIGWRGFLIFELRKIMPFSGVALISGLIWSMWHWPLIIKFGGGNTLLQISAFTIMIIGMSFILAYYTFKSNSLWPAALFHSVHNIYIQKILTPLTVQNASSGLWIDEYGLMIPIIAALVGFYFWRKAIREKL